MNSKVMLWQTVAIFTLSCLGKFDLIAGKSGAEYYYSGYGHGNGTQCSAGKFRCASGACIDKKYLCDGIKHCVFDGDDESRNICEPGYDKRNVSRCLPGHFDCSDGYCISTEKLCDGFGDCRNLNDERNDTCQHNKCSAEKFRCASGACMDRNYLCDGIKHCLFDGDDENMTVCQKTSSRNQPQNDTSCTIPSDLTDQTFTVHCPNTVDCSHQAGEPVPIFTQIRIACKAGYQFSEGNTSISSCFQGTWSPPISKCYRACAPVKNSDMELKCFRKIRGGSIPCDEAMPEDAIIYPKCKDYYHQDKQVDYSFIRCQSNGQWDRQLFKCIADCGRAQANTIALMRGGKPEGRGDSPWNVAIYDVSNPNELILICGGTIITPQIIVTAAHCFYNLTGQNFDDPSLYQVVVAKYTRDYKVKDNSETKVYEIRKIITPELIQFTGDSTNYAGDIALVRTSERITYSSLVLPACVEWTQTNRFIVPDGTVGKLVGWGRTENETVSNILLAASLPYINYRNCRNMIGEDFVVGLDKFCAGTKKEVGVQQGESGAGLLFRTTGTDGNLYYLRGIASNKGLDQTAIAAFTDIAQYANWIYEKRIEIENEEILAETTVGLKT